MGGLAGGVVVTVPLAAAGAAAASETPGAGAADSAGVVVTSDLVYGEAPDEAGVPEALRLDLYDPSAVPGVRPALVVVHGGGFDRGDKAEPVYVAMARAFARQGLVVAAVDYRLRADTYPAYPVASRDAQHDVQAAVRWLRANAAALRLDPERIAVTGHSAGAITALRVATHPDDPGESGTPDERSAVAGVLAVSGFLAGDVGAATPPLRMLHGTDDTLVPITWADDTCKRWEVAGGACDLLAYEGATHDATAFFDPASPEVTRFLACTVGGPVSFADVVPGSAMARAVAWSTGVGVLNPAVTGTLAPRREVTRGGFAAWAWRWAGRPTVAEEARLSRSPAVDWVVGTGVLHTRRDGRFAAAPWLTRAGAALALWRLAGRPVVPASAAIPGLDPGAKHAPAVEWLAAHGIDALVVGGAFRAAAPLRRVQLLRLLRGLSLDPTAWEAPPPVSMCGAA